jgi:hypothetical protein
MIGGGVEELAVRVEHIDHAFHRCVRQAAIRQILAVHVFRAHSLEHVRKQVQIRIKGFVLLRRARGTQLNPSAGNEIHRQQRDHQTVDQTTFHKLRHVITKTPKLEEKLKPDSATMTQ